jgi:hypothetical protein
MKSILRKFFDPGRPWLMACALASILACMFPAAEAQAPAPVDTVVEQQPPVPAPSNNSDVAVVMKSLEVILRDNNLTLRHAIAALRVNQNVQASQVPVAYIGTMGSPVIGVSGPTGPQPAPAPPPVDQAPVREACNGNGSMFGCFMQTMASGGAAVWEGVKAVGTTLQNVGNTLAPWAGPVGQAYSARMGKEQNIKVAEYGRDERVFLYRTFGDMNNVNAAAAQATALGLANGWAAQATTQHPPGTQLTVNGAGGPVLVQTGGGTQTNASGNPVMQPPVVVVGTTGTTVSRGP